MYFLDKRCKFLFPDNYGTASYLGPCIDRMGDAKKAPISNVGLFISDFLRQGKSLRYRLLYKALLLTIPTPSTGTEVHFAAGGGKILFGGVVDKAQVGKCV